MITPPSIQSLQPLVPSEVSRSNRTPLVDVRAPVEFERPSTAPPQPNASQEQLAERFVEKASGKALSLNSNTTQAAGTRRAIDTYQQTQEAGREFTEGVLVGIDVFA